MRVYLFHVDSGLFSGEDYCDPSEVREDEGITLLPPPDRSPGSVPVYDRITRRWNLIAREELEDRLDV